MLRDNLFLLSLAVLILLVLFVLGLVMWIAVRRSSTKPQAEQRTRVARMRFDSLRNSFRHAVELIEANIAARSERYSIPWVLVLGEGSGQEQLPIEQSGVASALSAEAATAASAQGISWHFFDKGIVVDVKGAYLGSPDDEDAAEKPWDEFLSLCRKYRPERPFDSVVITVPASLLLDDRPDARLELGKLAKLAHRRLWLAQNRFAMRFAVYVVVSGCEEIEGFAPFARALPESMRASMLGWSSPYDLSTTYQSHWTDEALNAVLKTVTDTSAELFATSGTRDAEQFFLLPSRIEKIRAQLQLYVDELLRPSAYHEPFFFRGIYLTGDSSESAQKAVAMGEGLPALQAPAEASADAPATVDTGDLVMQLSREPAFLRDLFEKKIFQEWGLTRPSKQQLSRPLLTRTARWAAIGVVGVWVIGLTVATWQLDTRYTDLSRALAQIQSDADYRARAVERGETIPSDWYRRKALALLAAIEKLSVDSAWTVFMPGSWTVFDDLEERASERIEREFGEIAINTLRRELYARASELTGVAQDHATGELIIGGECVPPGVPVGVDGSRKLTLAAEDLPEFASVLNYLAAVEQLDQAIQAMVRLQRPSQTESSDLRLLVKYTLGSDLPGNISRSLPYFRGGAGAPSPASLSIGPIQQATRCTLGKAMGALDNRLFAGNDLLATETRLERLTARLFAPGAPVTDYNTMVQGYRDVLAAIKDQENLLGPGKGAWMRQPTLNLGPAYDKVLARVASARLLGPDIAEGVRQRAYFSFQKFGTDLGTRLGSEATAGVVWSEKDGRYMLSAERSALRDAISALMNQSFMTAPRERQFPPVPSQATLAWDGTRLDQALALGEARKRFMAEGLQKFPLAMRRSVETFVDAQLARLAQDLTVEALSVVSRPTAGGGAPDPAGFEASRARLVKVQVMLAELGASERADDLRDIVSQDALNRLRMVDENLTRSELYALRGRDFRWWQGERAPQWQAFGVQDAAGLLQYLGQQYSRAETLGRQAEVYMSSLDTSDNAGQVALRWRAIQRDLERYKLKNPNSSLVALEQFLITLGPDLDRLNCTEKLAGKGPGSRPADYFAERHVQIYTSLMSRCTELRSREVQDQWAQFAGSFNRSLAGRAPFSQVVARDAPVADVEEVGQMLRAYDRVAPVFKAPPPPGSTSYAYNGQARRFAEQFERVKAFLAPLYPTEEGAAPGYDVVAEFRANQGSEVDGNKVIDWTLEIGGQVQRWREPPKTMRWEPGAPITLTLRLAKDSPASPVGDPNQPAMYVDGKAVVFKYADPWSLLSMIQRQREPETGARGDSRSQLLRLEFPLSQASPDGRSTPLETRSRVYLRLALSPVGKKTPVAWPGVFPVRAPDWAGP